MKKLVTIFIIVLVLSGVVFAVWRLFPSKDTSQPLVDGRAPETPVAATPGGTTLYKESKAPVTAFWTTARGEVFSVTENGEIL